MTPFLFLLTRKKEEHRTHLPIEPVLLGVSDFDQKVGIAVQDDENVDSVLKDCCILLALLLGSGIDGPTAIPLTPHLDICVLGCSAIHDYSQKLTLCCLNACEEHASHIKDIHCGA